MANLVELDIGGTEFANSTLHITGAASLTVAGTSTFTGGITEKVGTATATGTTITVDLATGNFFVFDLQSASGTVATFTVSNTNATANMLSSFIVKVQEN